MTSRKYIGARYVPLFIGDWDNTKSYEPLSIVMHEGNSYTSRQYVPIGVNINNETYWAETGNYNAQVEAYRQEVNNAISNLPVVSPNNVENCSLNKVYIIGIENDYGNNLNILYEKINHELNDTDQARYAYINYNEDTLIPALQNNIYDGGPINPIPSILNAMTYLDRDNITYSGEKAVWKTDYDGVANAMSCSDYAMLYLNGTPYDLSKFVGFPNIKTNYSASLPKDIKSKTPDGTIWKNAWNTREIGYNAFISGNFAYSEDAAISMLKPGDVMIIRNPNDNRHYFWDLVHCVIVVDVFPECGILLTLESVDTYVGGALYGDWSITTQGSTSGNKPIMVYRHINQYDSYVLFRPHFSQLNTYEEHTYRQETISSKTLTYGSANFIASYHPDNAEIIPHKALVTCEIENDWFIDAFANDENLDRISLQIRSHQNGVGNYIARLLIYRDDITNGYFTNKVRLTGYTLQDSPGFYIVCTPYNRNGYTTNPVTLSNIKYSLKYYTL